MMKSNFTLKKAQSAFTLIEVMVVVVILAILAAIIVPRMMHRPDEARIVKVKQDILSIESAMDLYKLDNGDYPTTEQGVEALVTEPTTPPLPSNWETGGYLKHLPVDPWGHSYHYLNPGKHGDIDIFTDGPHHTTTIGNWNVEQKSSS